VQLLQEDNPVENATVPCEHNEQEELFWEGLYEPTTHSAQLVAAVPVVYRPVRHEEQVVERKPPA